MDSNSDSGLEYDLDIEGGIHENPDSPPNNNLIWAVICTVFCCPPIGFYAIFKSIKINTLWNKGKYEEARKINYEVKKWSIIGIIFGIVLIACYLLFMFLYQIVDHSIKSFKQF